MASLVPRVDSPTPRVDSRTPRVDSRTPRVDSRNPRVATITPRMDSQTPRVATITPRVATITPRVDSRSPRVATITPRVDSLNPRVKSIVSRIATSPLIAPVGIRRNVARCCCPLVEEPARRPGLAWAALMRAMRTYLRRAWTPNRVLVAPMSGCRKYLPASAQPSELKNHFRK